MKKAKEIKKKFTYTIIWDTLANYLEIPLASKVVLDEPIDGLTEEAIKKLLPSEKDVTIIDTIQHNIPREHETVPYGMGFSDLLEQFPIFQKYTNYNLNCDMVLKLVLINIDLGCVLCEDNDPLSSELMNRILDIREVRGGRL